MSNSCLNEKKYGRHCPGPVDCFGDNEVFFRKVLIPTTMGDDRKYPPQNGAYRNALVVYEANGAIYIYSSDGLYTKLDVPSGVTSVNGMTGDVVLDIPEKLSQLQNDTGFITKDVDNLVNYSKTSAFARVAFTGSYLNLSDRPAINNGTLMINRNGSTVGTFKANQSESTTVNIRVPVYTNELINNSQFVVDGRYVHTDNNFNDEFKNKLAHLANITEIGDNLTLTNGRLDATGGGGSTDVQINGTSITFDDVANIRTQSAYDASTNKIATASDVSTAVSGKQDTLVSGVNIKTVNNESILGSGNITIDSLPSQTGHSGEFLTTNGTDASWAIATKVTIREWS